jgi:hypothetical protein
MYCTLHLVIFWLSLSVLLQRIHHHLHSHTNNKMCVNSLGTWIHYLYASMRLQMVQKVQIIHKSGLPHEKTRHFLPLNILCSKKMLCPSTYFPLKIKADVFVKQLHTFLLSLQKY